MVEKEESGAKNWAEEVDDDIEGADEVIGNEKATTEETKKEPEAPAKVYNLPERKRNKYGDFVVTNVKVKEKVIPTEAELEGSGDEEGEESSDEEEEQLVEIVKEETKEPVK
jgi:hypothetical protein